MHHSTTSSLLEHGKFTGLISTLLIPSLTNKLHRTARNSKPMEVLGTYNPIPQPDPEGEGRPFKDIKLDISRAKYWLGVGAQPSEPAWKLLSMVPLLQRNLNCYG